jgi:hypothetical protein
MGGTLWAEELGEHLDDMFAEGANVGKFRARLQRGGIFEETHLLMVINDGIHF